LRGDAEPPLAAVTAQDEPRVGLALDEPGEPPPVPGQPKNHAQALLGRVPADPGRLKEGGGVEAALRRRPESLEKSARCPGSVPRPREDLQGSWERGGRFSRNAVVPSTASRIWKDRVDRSASMRSPSSRVVVRARCTASRAKARAGRL